MSRAILKKRNLTEAGFQSDFLLKNDRANARKRKVFRVCTAGIAIGYFIEGGNDHGRIHAGTETVP